MSDQPTLRLKGAGHESPAVKDAIDGYGGDDPRLERVHRQRHQDLHQSLDELAADFIVQHPSRLLSTTTVMQLLEWSRGQTENPTLPK
jgi:hypothetical protein